MKKKITIYALSFIFLLSFSSCATILGGSKKGVRVTGNPPNAKVYYNGDYIGEAPVTVKVPKSAKQGNSKVTVKANNYKSQDITLIRKWSIGYTVLDILTGLVPLVIDAATGNIYQPKPGHITYNLEPAGNFQSMFKKGDKVLITSSKKKYENLTGEVVEVLSDKIKVKVTRPATTVEKQTKKVDEITEEVEFYYNEVQKK